MKRIFSIVLLACMTLTALADGGIKFDNITLKEALAKAGKEGKKVFVDCYIPTCGPCKFMAQNIFTEKECGDFMNPQYVSIMKDLEVDTDIAKNYDVMIYPTFLILNPDGTVFHKIEGGAVKEVPKFIEKMKNAIAIGEMKEKYNAGERNIEFLNEFFTALAKQDNRSLRQILDEYVPSNSIEQLTDPQRWELITSSVTMTNSQAFRHLFNNRKSLSKKLGAEKVNESLMAMYGSEFGNIKRATISNVDFTPRINDLKELEKEKCPGTVALRNSMLFRQVINNRQSNRIGEVVAAIAEVDKKVTDESARVEALKNLVGIERILDASQKQTVVSALKKACGSLSPENSSAVMKALPGLK